MIEVDALSYRFADGSWGLREVNAAFPFEGVTVLTGPNGAGKTLLSRQMLALLSPTSGRVLLDGRPAQRVEHELRRRVGLVFQDADSQFIGQSVAEDIAFGLEQRSPAGTASVNSSVQQALEAFELSDLRDRDPHTLSGGEKRRLAIASIAVVEPELLILDEPFANLDFGGVSSVLRSLLALEKAGFGVLVITHEIEKVLAHAERLVVMHHGTIVADSTPAAILPEVGRWGLRRPGESLERLTWIE